ncbi:MAG: hypothetical protein ACYTGQ_16465 [Planctomycetota bacterium]|jgi:nitrate reductase cytochrome c-type subunit
MNNPINIISVTIALLLLFVATAILAGADTGTDVTRDTETVANPEGFILEGLETRASRRAYFTAPPVIPHAIGGSDAECRSCHETKREFRGVTSNLTPHPYMVNCQQCHVKGVSPAYVATGKPVTNTFKGLTAPGKGTRAHDYAPPTVPHRAFLRENCNACHDLSSPRLTMKAPHPERASCAQCHVQADPRLDF